ncbi:uncharacterized protein [Miscanthus floridulus]|uniref:uncharacterized protein n=1 Tax=Miscanthus floridulus TaxID=154761 RepID=UPI0034576F1E
MLEYYAYRLQQHRCEATTLIHGDRLFQQYIVDAFASVEENRLRFIVRNNKNLRSEVYKGLEDALHKGDVDGSGVGKKVILPASFTGSKRYMVQNYQDAMAICRSSGPLDMFITFTCNPKWQEIANALTFVLGQRPDARPDIVSQVFKLKVAELVSRLKKGTYFGKARAASLFNEFYEYFTDDILYNIKKMVQLPTYNVPEDHLKNYVFLELDSLFVKNGGLMTGYGLPERDRTMRSKVTNRLLAEELAYDCEDLVGTGKTFLWNAIISRLQSEKLIVLIVASSGVASLLLPGPRTVHSRFKIPIVIDESSVCNIKRGTFLADLIAYSSLIIWDEAPMTHRHCFESLDHSMHDILGETNSSCFNNLFGGKTVVLGGDFRQVLPMVEGSSRLDTIDASITNSYLWNHVRILKLTINMRLLGMSRSGLPTDQVRAFNDWVLSIGDGTTVGSNHTDDGDSELVEIPHDILVPKLGSPIDNIIRSTYL